MSKLGFITALVACLVFIVFGFLVIVGSNDSAISDPRELGCAEFLNAPPMNELVKVRGCLVDGTSYVYLEDPNDSSMLEVLALLHDPTDETAPPAKVVLRTKKSDLFAVTKRATKLDNDELVDDAQLSRFNERYRRICVREIDIMGFVEPASAIDDPTQLPALFHGRLSSSFVVLTEDSEMEGGLLLGFALMLPSLALLVVLIIANERWRRRRVRILESRRRPSPSFLAKSESPSPSS